MRIGDLSFLINDDQFHDGCDIVFIDEVIGIPGRSPGCMVFLHEFPELLIRFRFIDIDADHLDPVTELLVDLHQFRHLVLAGRAGSGHEIDQYHLPVPEIGEGEGIAIDIHDHEVSGLIGLFALKVGQETYPHDEGCDDDGNDLDIISEKIRVHVGTPQRRDVNSIEC